MKIHAWADLEPPQTTSISSDHDKNMVKFEKDWHKTAGVAHTRYPLSIHFIQDWKITYIQNAEQCDNN